MKSHRYKSAITGKFVSKEFAEKNSGTTVKIKFEREYNKEKKNV